MSKISSKYVTRIVTAHLYEWHLREFPTLQCAVSSLRYNLHNRDLEEQRYRHPNIFLGASVSLNAVDLPLLLPKVYPLLVLMDSMTVIDVCTFICSSCAAPFLTRMQQLRCKSPFVKLPLMRSMTFSKQPSIRILLVDSGCRIHSAERNITVWRTTSESPESSFKAGSRIPDWHISSFPCCVCDSVLRQLRHGFSSTLSDEFFIVSWRHFKWGGMRVSVFIITVITNSNRASIKRLHKASFISIRLI